MRGADSSSAANDAGAVHMMSYGFVAALALGLLVPDAAQAAVALDGAAMSWPWALPFIGILLSIAGGPVLFPRVWHHHYGKIAAAWAMLALLAIAGAFGPSAALASLVHAVLGEYLDFILVLFALYTVAGGILIVGNFAGTPAVNAAILVIGTILASFMGTIGAAIILIRPLLQANEARARKIHVIVFFIILVANVGGALTPLGDPPLFVGFLRGIDFFWPLQHLWMQTVAVAALVLLIFIVLDSVLFRREKHDPAVFANEAIRVRLRGIVNLPLIFLIVGAILLSGIWKPGIRLDILGTTIELQNVLRDAFLIGVVGLSLWLTPDEHRAANG